jgi:hypothetical protein
MNRREVIKGAALGGIAASLLSPAAQATAARPDSQASEALAQLQAQLDELEAAFATDAWKLRTPQDFAEARRLLLHTMMHALQAWLEADPARPFFTSFINQHKKMLGDNPDARYFSAVIDAQHRYRVRGNLAGATYTSFTVELGEGTDGDGIGAAINDTEFTTDAEGNYEIYLGGEKRERNWLPLPAGASSVTTRHYYERKLSINNDRMHHIPIDIECLDAVPPRDAPSDAGIAAGIRRVTRFIEGTVMPMDSGATALPWVSRVPNTFNPPVIDDSNQSVTYAAKDNVYSMAPWVLGPDQALVIRGRFPRCRFANLVLFNRFLQTLNYEERTTSLNRAQTEVAADGSFEMIVAHRDPGRPNWLDTEGRAYGIMFWRFQLPEEAIAPLETEVITLP